MEVSDKRMNSKSLFTQQDRGLLVRNHLEIRLQTQYLDGQTWETQEEPNLTPLSKVNTRARSLWIVTSQMARVKRLKAYKNKYTRERFNVFMMKVLLLLKTFLSLLKDKII